MKLTALIAAVMTLALASTAAVRSPVPGSERPIGWTCRSSTPRTIPGLTLNRVVPREIDCGPIEEELDGYYRGVSGNGKRLRIAEGRPFYCGDIGDARLLAHPTIHGRRASLYEYCEGTGCGRATHRYLLTWREQGIQLTLISRGSPRPTLYAIARSMTRVTDTASARPVS